MSQPLPPEACASLADVRRQIDRLDRDIVALLAERGRYVLAAARFKRSVEEVHAPARVEEVIANVRRLAEEAGAPPAVVEQGYRALIAAYTVADSYAVKFLAMSPILLDYFSNFVRVGLLLPAALHDRAATARMWRAQWKYALLVAAISPVSYVLVLYAVQQAPISHVAPAREVSMLFAALIGGHLLREGDRLLRLLGAGFIAAGVVALALG